MYATYKQAVYETNCLDMFCTTNILNNMMDILMILHNTCMQSISKIAADFFLRARVIDGINCPRFISRV